ncbi:hypothetical protein RhiirA1_460446 [Rhizophagus irregularis]|uniref:Uncharacterized protein n=1 Tax=Rhizophagus irregularis TaxID=588596 RepID=A0A2N0RRH6_9GLOM|nr:hypothetical protein RhiirA1_460446 [Rhizophagus irregularis]
MQGNSGIKPMQIVVIIPVRNLNREEILQGGLRGRALQGYVEKFENRARDIRSQDSSVTDPTARSRAYREVAQHPPENPEGKEYIQVVCEDRNKQDQAGEII